MDDTGAACAKAKQNAGKRMYERIVEFGNMESMGKLIFFFFLVMSAKLYEMEQAKIEREKEKLGHYVFHDSSKT